MATVDTKITIDSEVKTQAQEMLAGFGREIPNKETLTALEEAEDMESHPELYKTFANVDDLMRDLLDEV